jgi:PAS domain-containing protein
MYEEHAEGCRVSDSRSTTGGSEAELRERLTFERATTQMLRALVDCHADEIDGWIVESLALVGQITGADRTFAEVSPAAFGQHAGQTYEWRREDADGATQSRVAVRMMVRDEVVGSVGADAVDTACEWSPATHGLLEQFAGLVANAFERRRSAASLAAGQEHFKRLVQNSPDVVLVIDPMATFMYASPQITNLLGYDPEELIGTSALDLIHPDEIDEVAVAIVNTI